MEGEIYIYIYAYNSKLFVFMSLIVSEIHIQFVVCLLQPIDAEFVLFASITWHIICVSTTYKDRLVFSVNLPRNTKSLKLLKPVLYWKYTYCLLISLKAYINGLLWARRCTLPNQVIKQGSSIWHWEE